MWSQQSSVAMLKLLLLAGLSAVLRGVLGGVTRTTQEVDDFRAFLKKTQANYFHEDLDAGLEEEQNPWERSGRYEGDILLSERQQLELLEEFQGTRNAMSEPWLWENNTLAYQLSPDYTAAQVLKIKSAMNAISNVSCIIFKERTPQDRDWVKFLRSGGCASFIGCMGGGQVLALSSGCVLFGSIQHELLHALGFYHQQSAAERDDYVTIKWENIEPGREYQFRKVEDSLNLGVEYDYGSVMHYSQRAFTNNGNYTIVLNRPTILPIGQRKGLSASDILKLNRLYKCPGFEKKI